MATDAKLEKILSTPDYSWLREPSVVIVDEAHRSMGSRYTDLLRDLGLTHSQTRRPLIGLSATPFRGRNEEETRRLVDRYGRNRLDSGIFDTDSDDPHKPYKELQDLGVLAEIDHRELEGATIALSEDEARTTADRRLLPSGVEKRLADDTDRNTMLIKAISDLPDDWPVLLFATSVEHAQVMAAMLNEHGIPADSIESGTSDADRRSTIEKFRNGRIRVLANYGVLAQGFDAPATRVVVIARPTYSPNTYQQMIGRGLRGPKNGGKDTCLILDVRDNFENFDEELAFTQFEYLWTKE